MVLISADRMMMLYINTKFHENSQKVSKLLSGTRNDDGQTDRQTDRRTRGLLWVHRRLRLVGL